MTVSWRCGADDKEWRGRASLADEVSADGAPEGSPTSGRGWWWCPRRRGGPIVDARGHVGGVGDGLRRDGAEQMRRGTQIRTLGDGVDADHGGAPAHGVVEFVEGVMATWNRRPSPRSI